jgi:hypothetical protein
MWRRSKKRRVRERRRVRGRRIRRGCRFILGYKFRHMWMGNKRRRIRRGCRFIHMWMGSKRICIFCSRLVWRRIRRRRTMWWSRGYGWFF